MTIAYDGTIDALVAGDVIVTAIAGFDGHTPDQIRKERREKFMAIGRDA